MRALDIDTVRKIEALRRKGLSYNEINLKINLPKSTISKYANNVKIHPKFIKKWAGKRGGSSKRKLLKEKRALVYSRNFLSAITRKERILFLSALYWAEGSKKDFGLSNTDPDLIKVFINGLRNDFEIKESDIRVSIRIYEDLNKEKCLNFWSKITGVKKENFCSINILAGKRHGKLKYGMCRIRVLKGGDLLKKIKSINTVFCEKMSP
jgi:transcriptional regulator with XRE-family HTH domain